MTEALVVGGLAVAAALYELARRVGLPFPTVLVLGGLVLAAIPGLPRLRLEPDLILLVFLPPLLFSAASESPMRDLRQNLWPILRLSVGLVLLTIVCVAATARLAIPNLRWSAALVLGAIVAPTDALAAMAVIRRIRAPRIISTLVEGESLFNDASALVAYRLAVVATLSSDITYQEGLFRLVGAATGGILLGYVVGRAAAAVLTRVDDPPVEVAISLIVPFTAYLPAEALGSSAVLAAVTAGLVIGRRLGSALSPDSRLLWLTTWRMIGFVVNAFAFLLLGLELPVVLEGVANRDAAVVAGQVLLISIVVIVVRLAFAGIASLLPGSARRRIAQHDPTLAWWVVILVGWSGLRGAVSLAAALALPANFPERDLMVVVTFGVIVVTLVGQGLTLPAIARRLPWDGTEIDGDEAAVARHAAYDAALAEIENARLRWPTHQPLLDQLRASYADSARHMSAEEGGTTDDQLQERVEHEQIQREIIAAERHAVTRLRDRGMINDQTLRQIERELDLEEMRMRA